MPPAQSAFPEKCRLESHFEGCSQLGHSKRDDTCCVCIRLGIGTMPFCNVGSQQFRQTAALPLPLSLNSAWALELARGCVLPSRRSAVGFCSPGSALNLESNQLARLRCRLLREILLLSPVLLNCQSSSPSKRVCKSILHLHIPTLSGSAAAWLFVCSQARPQV